MPGKLDVDESKTPVVMPPHRVPIALKAKLEAELERLENLLFYKTAGEIKKKLKRHLAYQISLAFLSPLKNFRILPRNMNLPPS